MKQLKLFSLVLVAFISSFFLCTDAKAYLTGTASRENAFDLAPVYNMTFEYYYIDAEDNRVEYKPVEYGTAFKGAVYNIGDDLSTELDYSEVKHYVNGNVYTASTYVVLRDTTIAEVYTLNRYNVLFSYSYVDEFDQKHELQSNETRVYNKGKEITLRSNLLNEDYSSVDYVINDSPYVGDVYTIQGADTIEEIYNLTRYGITYNLDGGTVNDNPSIYTKRTANITLNNPNKLGYVFRGWTGSNGTTPSNNVTIVTGTTGDLSYVANYDAITSDITISVTDETIVTSTKTVTLTAILSNITTNEVVTEYSLDGGDTWIEYTAPFVIDKNITIKARTRIIADDYVIGEAEKEITTIIVITANLVDGSNFNRILKELSGQYGGGSWNENYTITAIRRSATEPANYGSAQRISNQWDSPVDVWAWYDNGVIYYYTTADKLFVDANAMGMFARFKALTDIEMIDELDTTHATSMMEMFAGDSALTSLDLRKWDTSNVTTMQQMFEGCSGLNTIDLSSFNTSNVTSMYRMFGEIGVEELDLSSFDTHLITDMNQMFANLTNLRILNISSFNTSNVTSMYQMFYNDSNLEQIIFGDDFITSSVTNMYQMFQGCSSIKELDLSSFDTSNVQNMGAMFWGMSSLETIYVYDDFDRSSLTGSWNMFAEDIKLVGEMGTSLATTGNVTDVTYAKIDNQWQQGYFTRKRRP